MSEPACIAELEQRRLLLLNGYLDGSHNYIRDGKCAYCGIKPIAVSPLCDVCEARRLKLLARYPELHIGKLRHMGNAGGEWSPHNSE